MDTIAHMAPFWFGLTLSLLLGWGLGGLGNWAADQLPHHPARPLTWDAHARRHAWTLLWRGRSCPTCGARAGLRSPLLEVGTAVAFAVTWWRFAGEPALLVLVWIYTAYLLAVAAIDFEHRRVLNNMLLPAALAALIGSFVPGAPGPVAAALNASSA